MEAEDVAPSPVPSLSRTMLSASLFVRLGDCSAICETVLLA